MRFAGCPWYGGAFSGGDGAGPARAGASSFQLFSACALDFLVLHLECNAPDDVLAWAARTIAAHPTRRVIVVTHMGLGPAAKPVDKRDFHEAPKGRMRWKKVHGVRGNTPQQMWDKCYRKQARLFLILNGDQSRSQALRMVSESDAGTSIHEVLSDYNQENRAWMRLYRFLPDRDEIRVLTFDSTTGTLCRGTRIVPDAAQHCFTIPYPMRAVRTAPAPSP